jgi:hypothetical protein
MLAAWRGQAGTTRLLLQRGSEIDAITSVRRAAVLRAASTSPIQSCAGCYACRTANTRSISLQRVKML